MIMPLAERMNLHVSYEIMTPDNVTLHTYLRNWIVQPVTAREGKGWARKASHITYTTWLSSSQ